MSLRNKALSLGASDFGVSKVKGKKYYVIYEGKRINFASDVGKTFLDHKDNKKRDAWRARHSKIKNKNGQLVYKLKSSASYWSWHLLW